MKWAIPFKSVSEQKNQLEKHIYFDIYKLNYFFRIFFYFEVGILNGSGFSKQHTKVSGNL